MGWGQGQAAAPGKVRRAMEGEGGNVLHSFKKFDEEGRRGALLLKGGVLREVSL